jgi:hypothetical protein
MYSAALSNMEILLKSIRCPVLIPCSAMADFLGCSKCICLKYSLHLASQWTFQSVQRILHRIHTEFSICLGPSDPSWLAWACVYSSFVGHDWSWYYILLGAQQSFIANGIDVWKTLPNTTELDWTGIVWRISSIRKKW